MIGPPLGSKLRTRRARVSKRAGFSCATAPDPRGNVHCYYEVEPLGVYRAEIITGSNLRFYYASGEELVRPDR